MSYASHKNYSVEGDIQTDRHTRVPLGPLVFDMCVRLKVLKSATDGRTDTVRFNNPQPFVKNEGWE